MRDLPNSSFADRLKTGAEAKKALLANFRAKPTVTDPNLIDRAEARAAELQKVRQERLDAKTAKKEAAAAAEEAIRLAQAASEEAELDAKRGARKARKALTEAEAKAKRDARYAGRKARR